MRTNNKKKMRNTFIILFFLSTSAQIYSQSYPNQSNPNPEIYTTGGAASFSTYNTNAIPTQGGFAPGGGATWSSVSDSSNGFTSHVLQIEGNGVTGGPLAWFRLGNDPGQKVHIDIYMRVLEGNGARIGLSGAGATGGFEVLQSNITSSSWTLYSFDADDSGQGTYDLRLQVLASSNATGRVQLLISVKDRENVPDVTTTSLWQNAGSNIYYDTSGSVGIGTSSPGAKLHVNGSVMVGNGDWGALIVDGKDQNDWLFNAHNGGEILGIRTQLDGQTLWSNQVMTLNRLNGNVGIGTTEPDSKLTVKGNIHAEEVKVDLSVPGPDYVFKEDYNLKSLKEVQDYIKDNGHLPNIPSAKEMEENGVQIGEMNMKLLEKIEELTLYTIEQQKQIDLYQKFTEQLKELQTQNQSLQNQIIKLEKMIK